MDNLHNVTNMYRAMPPGYDPSMLLMSCTAERVATDHNVDRRIDFEASAYGVLPASTHSVENSR